MARLGRLPGVEHLSPDSTVQKLDEFGYAVVGAGAASASPYCLSGAGITVAVFDSGIQPSGGDLRGLRPARG